MLTQARLKSILDYDPITGVFTWKIDRGKAKTGSIAGCDGGLGYRRIRIDNKDYRSNRLAWLYVHGYFPDCDIDHKNLDKMDDSFYNLRLCTESENLGNTTKRKSNTSGYKGVTFKKEFKKYQAYIKYKGKSYHLGYYEDPMLAFLIRQAVEIDIYGDFVHYPNS